MADNTTLGAMTGGDVIATDDIGGVKYQRVKNTYGSDGTAVDVDASHGLPVAGQFAEYTAATSAGTVSTVLIGPVEVRGYSLASVQVTGSSLQIYVEVSNDGANWRIPALWQVDWLGSVPQTGLPIGAPGIFLTPVVARYLRVRQGSIGAAGAVTLELSNTQWEPAVRPVLPGATFDVRLGAMSTFSPTDTSNLWGGGSSSIPAAQNLWGAGSTYERQRTASAAQGAAGTGVAGAANLYYDGAVYQRVTPTAPLPVTIDTGTLLQRIEELEFLVRQLASGAGAQMHDGSGRTRVSLEQCPASLTMAYAATAVLPNVSNQQGLGGYPVAPLVPALMNGGFDALRRGITVS